VVVKQGNFRGWRRSDRPAVLMIAALALTAGCAGCSWRAKQSASEPIPSAAPDQSADSSQAPGPEAKIQISYSQPNDYLSTLSMTKFAGATVLETAPGPNGVASVVRFDGGEPTWQINIEPGMFSAMPFGATPKNYAVNQVKYGTVPLHFVQTIPDTGPPEPLEPDHFYIFSVTRESGSISYDAVKVNVDGSLQAYEADPRAGSSFRLCCNLTSDFTVVEPPSAIDTPPPSDAPGPQQ